MARSLPLILCLATSLLAALSGCASDDPSGPVSEPAEPNSASADGPDAAVAPQGGDGAGPAGADVPSEPAVAVCEAVVNAGAGVAGNFQSAYLACPFDKAGARVKDYGSALVEASWPDALPTETEFYLYLLSDSCSFSSGLEPCWHGQASSTTSTVRLEADAALLGEAGSDGLRAWTGVDGVAVQQKVAIAITLVPAGQALPDGYTALP